MQHLNNALTRGNKSWIGEMAMPSDSFINLIMTSGDTYTAPANGYFVFDKVAGSTGEGKYFGAELKSTTGSTFSRVFWLDKPEVATYNACAIIPASKGQSLHIFYTLTGESKYFRFIYAKGEV